MMARVHSPAFPLLSDFGCEEAEVDKPDHEAELKSAFEGASSAELKPHKLEGTMAFMFETRFPQRVTAYAAGIEQLQKDYGFYGHRLTKHFNPKQR